ncbi:hypothetical protein FRB99_007857, partial [Tulasnella sp. 403]
MSMDSSSSTTQGLRASGTDDDLTTSMNSSASKVHRNSIKGERPKYTRLLQSCDSCRARKVRCVQVDSSDPEKDGITMTLGPNAAKKIPFCKPCIAASISCTYHFKAKKRGPPNQHVRRLRAAAAATSTNGEAGIMTLDPVGTVVTGSAILSPELKSQSSASSQVLREIGPSQPLPSQNHATTSQQLSSSGDVSVSPIPVLMARSGVIGSDWNVPKSDASRERKVSSTGPKISSGSPQSTPLSTSSPTSLFSHTPLAPEMQPPFPPSTSPVTFSTHRSPPARSMKGFGIDRRASEDVASNRTRSPTNPSPLFSHFSTSLPPPPRDIYSSPSSATFAPYAASASGSTLSASSPLTPSAPHPSVTPGMTNTSPNPYALSNLAPTHTILHILSLFFDFVWPLTPCIHRPSFYSDLGEKREERDPIFFALVCSTVASTLVQVPRSYLPMDRTEVRVLARRFNEASRNASRHALDPPTTSLVVIRYFDHIYYFREGKEGASNAAFGEALLVSALLRMHEEDSYESLDYIEREVRKRAFWLLYDGMNLTLVALRAPDLTSAFSPADKSVAAIHRRPVSLTADECTSLLPTEVDDEFITTRAILPQPPNKTPILSGFIYISKIFILCGEITAIIRRDRHKPPTDAAAVARLEEVCDIHRRITNIFADAPPELRLRSSRKTSSATPGFDFGASDATGATGDIDGYTQAAIAEVNQLFDNPNANRDDAGNAFLVMQANVHVTQHMIRLMVEQHRHQLVTCIRSTGYDLSLIHSPVVAAEIARGGWTADDRELVARDLLHVLHSIPILSIATNGPSLVHKVRFVASTLLDSIREADTAPTPAARALTYLWDFLSILSEIERNYSVEENQSSH